MKKIVVSFTNVNLQIPINDFSNNRLFKFTNSDFKVGGDLLILNNKTYVNALKDISFCTYQGDRVALLGHNGAGKSTLLKSISGIYQETSGRILINGDISCIFDLSLALNGDLSGLEYIKYWCLLKNISTRDVQDIINDVSNFTELGDYLFLPTRIYSDGMRSRLQVSLATTQSSDILLIDEGIGAGDSKFHEKFQVRLNKFINRSSTLFLASHNISLLKKFCNIGFVLSKGSIVFSGTLTDSINYYESIN